MKSNGLPTGITLRKDGRYMWRFKYAGVEYSGYSQKLGDCKKALTAKRYEVEHGIYSKEQQITFDAWFTEWMGTYRGNTVKDSTANLYWNTYNRYIKPEFGKKQLKSLKPEQIQKFTNRMAGKYSETVAGQANYLLYDCLQQAANLRIIAVNPMQNTVVPKFRESEKKRAVSAEQEKIFLKATESSKYYPVYRMASLSGMRIGEILGLQWDCVSFDNETITVRRTMTYISHRGLFLDTPKSKSSNRTIPMAKGGKLWTLLHEQAVKQKKQRMKAGELWEPLEGMDNLVFTTETGKPFYSVNIASAIRVTVKRLKESGTDLGNFTFHTLRHCFATRCIEGGMNPKTLQSILGHATFAMAMDLYGDVMENTRQEEMRAMNEAL